MTVILIVGWFAVLVASYFGAEIVLKLSGKL
jgi:hypothetical protein